MTSAVTKLKVQGLPIRPSGGDRVATHLRRRRGRDGQVIRHRDREAVSGASPSEFERLREAFNVVGQGRRRDFHLRGHDDDGERAPPEEIVKYPQSIGKTNFAGGMAKQAATLAVLGATSATR